MKRITLLLALLSFVGCSNAIADQAPQIRMTLVQGTPVTSSDVTSALSVCMEPYNSAHNQLSIYDGVSNWASLDVAPSTYCLPATQTQTCTLTGSVTVTCPDTSQMTPGEQVAASGIPSGDTILSITNSTTLQLATAATGSGSTSVTFTLPPLTNYDIYAVNNSGVPKLVWSAAWTDDTHPPARALQDGVEVAAADHTKRLLASVRTISVPEQLEDSQTHRWLSNYYNPVTRFMRVVDPTPTWNYSSFTAFEQAHNNPANQLDYIAVVPRAVSAIVQAAVISSAGAIVTVGIGLDGNLGNVAQTSGDCNQASIPASLASNSFPTSCVWAGDPGLGHHTVLWLELGFARGTTQTWLGYIPPTQISGIMGSVQN